MNFPHPKPNSRLSAALIILFLPVTCYSGEGEASGYIIAKLNKLPSMEDIKFS